MNSEGQRLADWSRAVRESTLKRLHCVPSDLAGWRPVPEALSFTDIAHHLAAADRWLFAKLAEPSLPSFRARVGEAARAGSQLSPLLVDLSDLGEHRGTLLSGLDEHTLRRLIPDDRFGGEVTVWWVIVRGNLDHEVHHRGQIAAYLRQLSLHA